MFVELQNESEIEARFLSFLNDFLEEPQNELATVIVSNYKNRI